MGAPATYGDRFTVDAISILGKVYQLKIKEKDYVGSVSVIKGTGAPFIRNLKGDNDVMEDRILRSTFKFELTAETEGEFRDLFTFDWKKYIAELWRDSAIYWCGYLSPDFYSEPWTSPPYTIVLDAHDGLGQLKQLDFKTSILDDTGNLIPGTIFTDKISLAEVVGQCLYKIMPFTYLYEGINIIEEHQDTAKSMLTETFIQAERFYQSGTMNCYDALLEVLKLCNGQIFQQNGIWWIVSVGNRKGAYTRKILNLTETVPGGLVTLSWSYGASITYDPQQAITDEKASNSLINCWYDAPTMTILPAWKKFDMKFNLGYKENVFDPTNYTLINNPDVEIYQEGDVIPSDHLISIGHRGPYTCNEYTILYKNTNNGTVQFNLGYFIKEDDQAFKMSIDFTKKVKLQRSITSMADRIEVTILVGSTTYYLWDDGSWRTSRPTSNTFGIGVVNNQLVDPVKVLDILPLPGDGFIFVSYIHNGPVGNDSFIVLLQKSCITVELTGMDIIQSIDVTTHISNNQSYIPDAIEMMFADFPDVENAVRVYAGGIWYKVDSNTYGITSNWLTSQSPALKPLLNLLADEIGVLHTKPTWMLSGQLIGNLKPGSTIIDYHADRKFIMIRFDEDCYNDEWDMDMIEISGEPQAYLKLKQGGHLILKSGGKIKIQ